MSPQQSSKHLPVERFERQLEPWPYRLVIFDADGTLRECTVPGQPCPNKPDEWKLRPMVAPMCRRLIADGTKAAIASNQAGANPKYGFLSQSTAIGMLEDLAVAAFGEAAKSDGLGVPTPAIGRGAIICSTDLPGEESVSRKPAPGMLLYAMAYYGIGPHETLMVGDSEEDRGAAKNAGCDFCWAWDFFGWPAPGDKS